MKRLLPVSLLPMLILCSTMLLLNLGCKKESDSVDPDQCIRATVVYTGCAGVSIVQVHNSSIGTEWNYGSQTYNNAIMVNLPNTIGLDSTVSFTIVRKAQNFEDICGNELRLCNTNISIPGNIFCINNISSEKCSPTDEK